MGMSRHKKCPKCGQALSDSAVFCERCGTRIFSKDGKESADPYIGTVIDNTFEVESILGTGSMGIVYKAWHRMLKCHVALKVLRHDFIGDRLILQRFQREAESANKLSHPNVIRVLHFGKTGLNAPYIAMECLDGMELAQLVAEEFPLNQRRVCMIALQTARALRAAHAANIIHRDLKPANIVIVNQNGEEIVKVLDFGIAKVAEGKGEGLTREGAICGTPAFMSPEQIIGRQITPAADIFSFGSVLYYMLTCKLPFNGTELIEVASSILTQTPVLPSQARFDAYIDPRLESICMKCLEKEVANRFRTADELVTALEAAIAEIPFVNPSIRSKVVVGDRRVDANADTCCELPVFHDDTSETNILSAASIDLDDEVTVARPRPFLPPVPGRAPSDPALAPSEPAAIPGRAPSASIPVPGRAPSAPIPPGRAPSASLPVPGRAPSASLPVPGRAPAPQFTASKEAATPGNPALTNTSSAPNTSERAGERTILQSIVSAMPRETLEERKKMFLLIVCAVVALCVITLIIIIIFKNFFATPVQRHTESATKTEVVEEPVPEPPKPKNMAIEEISMFSDIASLKAHDGACLGATYGISPGSDRLLRRAIDAKQSKQAKKPEANNPRDNTAGQPKHDAAPAPAPREDKTAKPANSPKQAPKSSAGKVSQVDKAEKLYKSGEKAKACAMYRSLDGNKSLTETEQIRVTSALRSCKRISI